ncbi:MAG TPA: FAD-binding protein, partial [Actinomycetota bacterium]|nr:FAD-binding protein [Actinomycetota bacterium]
MRLESVARALEEALPGRVRRDAPLAPLTTYRLGGPAAVLVEPGGPDDVAVVGEALGDAGDVPLLVLGRGSNTVVSDEGWPGVVVHAGPGLAWISDGPDDASLEAGAGTSMPQLANWAARRGLSGLEFLVSIPGSVGGGVRMNAGAHGGEISDHLEAATVLDMDARTVERVPAGRLGLGYRRSALGPEH